MALTDWIQTGALIYFAWQQNRIFKRQNEIFAAQSDRTAMLKTQSWTIPFKRYWPTFAMLALAVLTLFDIYDRHHPGLAWSQWLWLAGAAILVPIAVSYVWFLLAQKLTVPAADVPSSDTHRDVKSPTKLIIQSANYRAIRDGGEQFEVDELLRKMITGDTLVFGPIENHSFVIDGRNLVPTDPYSGERKRLKVRYSYGNKPVREIVRYEHDILVLPEDSEIERLTTEIEKTKLRQFPRLVFTLQRVISEGPATSPTVFLKNKVRMILTNHLDRDVCVWTPLWDSSEVHAEGSPPGSTIQLAKSGWEFDEWEDEKTCVTVPIGRSFRCYIALHPTVGQSIAERIRTNAWLGTALFPVKIDGKLYEVPIEIGQKPGRKI
jgi:hypothetical protein